MIGAVILMLWLLLKMETKKSSTLVIILLLIKILIVEVFERFTKYPPRDQCNVLNYNYTGDFLYTNFKEHTLTWKDSFLCIFDAREKMSFWQRISFLKEEAKTQLGPEIRETTPLVLVRRESRCTLSGCLSRDPMAWWVVTSCRTAVYQQETHISKSHESCGKGSEKSWEWTKDMP